MSGIDLGSIYSSLDLKLDKFEVGINSAVKGFYKLQLDTEKSSNIMDTKVTTAVNNIAKSYDIWEKANEKTSRSIFDNSKKIDSLGKQIKLLDEEIKKSDEVLEDIEKQCGKNSEEAGKYKSRVLELKDAQSKLTHEMKESEKQTGTWRGKLQLLETEFSKIDDKYKYFDKIGSGFQSVGNKMTMGLTLPIVGMGVASSKMAMDFEHGMKKVNTIAALGKEDLSKLSKETLKLSDATGVGAKDLAEMEYNALSASVSVKDLTSVVTTSGTLAKGGFADANDSLRLLTSTYNVYREDFEKMGISQTEASKIIADKMIAIQNLGETTVAKLAASMGQLTPIAKAAGANLDEVGAGMIVLTKNGVETSEAVTGLKSMFSNLIKPSDQARKMAQSIGLEFDTTALKTKGLGGFLEDLREKLKGSSPALLEASDKVSKYQHAIDNATKDQKKNKDQMREWKNELTNAKKELKVLSKSGGETVGTLGQLFGSVEGLSAVLSMTSKYGMKDFQDGMKACKDSAGSTQKAADEMGETAQEKFTKGMNKIKNVGIELGVKMLPTFEKGISLISNLADKFNALSPAMQDNILKMAIATATVGPLFKVIGGGISGIGSILSGSKKIGTALGLFKTASAGASVATAGLTGATATATGGIGLMGIVAKAGALLLNPWVLGIGAAALAGYGLYKHLQKEVVPSVDLFNNKVQESQIVTDQYGNKIVMCTTKTMEFGEATKKAVGSYVKLNDEASKTLTDFYVKSTKITTDTAKTLTDKYDTMGTQIKEGMDKKYTEMYKKNEEFFKNSNTLTDTEEKDILTKLQKTNENKKVEIDNYIKQIQTILKNASDENRELKADEQKTISDIQDKMKVSAVKNLSETEVESKVILERIKSYGTRITAEQSADIVKNAETSRVKSVDEANKNFIENKAMYEQMRDVTHEITADQAEKLIAEAEKQRDESIKKANELKEGVVDKLKQMNPDIEREVNLQTGTIMKKWDKVANWWNNLFFNKKSMEVETKYIPPNGTYGSTSRVENNYSAASWKYGNRFGYATGTENATPGLHEVAENGFEIVTGRQYRFFNGGEKVFNNEKSKELLKSLTNNSTAENIAKEAMVEAKEKVSITPKVSVEESTIKNKNSSMLDSGSNGEQYEEYMSFIDKLNQDEVKKSKELLDKEYKNRVFNLGLQIREVRKTNKEKAKELENSKDFLKKYHDEGIDLLNKRSEHIKDTLNTDENLFKNKVNSYDEAIKRLSIDTKDLNKNLENHKAIVILQKEKVEILKNRYDQLCESFGATSDEAISAKTAFEDAKTEIISMANEVIEAKQKIDKGFVDGINKFADKIKNALKEKYAEEENTQEESLNTQLENLDNWKEESIEKINSVYDTKIKRLEESSNLTIKTLEKQLDALDQEEKEHDIVLKDKEDSERESEIKKLLSMNYSKKKKAELQKELDALLKAREERKYKENIDAQKGNLQQQIKNEHDKLEEKKKQLEEDKEHSLKVIEDTYEADKDSLEKRLKDLKKFYVRKLKEANLNAEAEKLIIDNNQKDIVELLGSYGDIYENVGITLGDKLVQGFTGQINNLQNVIEGVTNDISRDLFSSVDFGSVRNANYVRDIPNERSIVNNRNNTTQNTIQSLFTAEKVVLGDGKSMENFMDELWFHFEKKFLAKGGTFVHA